MALQALKGKFVRRDEGGNLIFGSQRKPEWRPMSPACDTAMLRPGEYFEIQVDQNKVYAITGPLAAMASAPQAQSAPAPSDAPQGAPASAQATLSEKDEFICATAVVKSGIEQGLSADEAFAAAIAWVREWRGREFHWQKDQRPPPVQTRPPGMSTEEYFGPVNPAHPADEY